MYKYPPILILAGMAMLSSTGAFAEETKDIAKQDAAVEKEAPVPAAPKAAVERPSAKAVTSELSAEARPVYNNGGHFGALGN